MEPLEALERVDANRVFAEAEQLLASGEVEGFEQFVRNLENRRQQYLDIEKQASATLRQFEQQFAELRSELAYNPNLVEQYREVQLLLDMQVSRMQAGRKEAESIAGILLKLRPQLERFTGRRKAIELAVRAQEIRAELHQLKQTLLPGFEHVIEKVMTLQREAAAFNRTAAVAHLPQTQFLQCRVDLTQLLAALAELDVIVVPEMEELAALRSQTHAEDGRQPQQFPHGLFQSPAAATRIQQEE